jgi:hypothetical protein
LPKLKKTSGDNVTGERRLQIREIPAELAFIQISGDEGGRIRNISEKGLCFETFASIEQEKRLRFWFSLNLRDRIEASGTLAWMDADRKIGGLRFLDLSARAQRHLRTHLKNANIANIEEPTAKGSAFLAALSKRSSTELALKQQPVDDARLGDEISGIGVLGTNTPPEESSGQPARDFGSSNLIGMVSLERHLKTSRRQFIRGILLGAAATLALMAVGGKYFGPRPASSGPGASTAPPIGLTAGAPVTPASPGTIEGQDTSISSKTVVDPHSALSRYSPDNPRSAASLRSASSSEVVRGADKTRAEPREGESKLAKKSSATPEQLWAAVRRGNATAAVALADRYLQGDGVPQHCDQARVLLLVASEKNNADAIRKLHELDSTGCPAPSATSAPPSPTKDLNNP